MTYPFFRSFTFLLFLTLLSCTAKKESMDHNNDTAIKAITKEMLVESRIYIHMEAVGLKTAFKLQNLLKDHLPDENKFTPIELFFMVETDARFKQKVSLPALRRAYCAAVQQLPPDWWSLPGPVDNSVTQHLVAIPGIEKCLRELLPDAQRLQYMEGEHNTLALDLQWQRGDLAAGLIAAVKNKEFDFFVPLRERLKVRKELLAE